MVAAWGPVESPLKEVFLRTWVGFWIAQWMLNAVHSRMMDVNNTITNTPKCHSSKLCKQKQYRRERK